MVHFSLLILFSIGLSLMVAGILGLVDRRPGTVIDNLQPFFISRTVDCAIWTVAGFSTATLSFTLGVLY